MGPLHGAHQNLRVWTNGEAKSHTMKKELAFPGHLLYAKNSVSCLCGSGTTTTHFIEKETEAQRHREVNCLAQGHSASEREVVWSGAGGQGCQEARRESAHPEVPPVADGLCLWAGLCPSSLRSFTSGSAQ